MKTQLTDSISYNDNHYVKYALYGFKCLSIQVNNLLTIMLLLRISNNLNTFIWLSYYSYLIW